MPSKVVFKITYPNGKIYIGSDVKNDINFFGSAKPELIERDFTRDQWRDFTIRREMLWESDNASDGEVRQVKKDFIVELRANSPDIGYNQNPK